MGLFGKNKKEKIREAVMKSMSPEALQVLKEDKENMWQDSFKSDPVYTARMIEEDIGLSKEIEESCKKYKEELEKREREIAAASERIMSGKNTDIHKLSEKESHQYSNLCILTKHYFVDAWLTIAKAVYTNPEVAKKYEKEIAFIDYVHNDLGIHVRNCLKEHNGYYYGHNKFTSESHSKMLINLYNYYHGTEFIFEFGRLYPDNAKYLERINRYVQNEYNTTLDRYDSTFSIDTAFMIMTDILYNGVSADFQTYCIQENKLREILRLRNKSAITNEEFNSVDDYGKILLVPAAVKSKLIHIDKNAIPVNTNKAIQWIENGLNGMLRRAYNLDEDELKQDVDIKKLDKIKDYFARLPKMYPLYYFDNTGNRHTLQAYLTTDKIPDIHDKFSFQTVKRINEEVNGLCVSVYVYNPKRLRRDCTRLVGRKKWEDYLEPATECKFTIYANDADKNPYNLPTAYNLPAREAYKKAEELRVLYKYNELRDDLVLYVHDITTINEDSFSIAEFMDFGQYIDKNRIQEVTKTDEYDIDLSD